MRTNLMLVVALLAAAQPVAAQRSGPNGNLVLPPAETMHRMCEAPFQILEAKGAGGGVMGARRWKIKFDDGQELTVKWKQAPKGGDGWNNSPRLEIAAYVVQQLFIEPDDYVVPPVCGRCVPFDVYRTVDDDPKPNLPDATCVFGAFSAWLDNVREPEHPYDPERFSKDLKYAYRFARLNLLTYLVSQHDARGNNFLVSTVSPDDPQFFVIDNGISFDSLVYNWFAWHLNELRIGGLERQSVDRLRRVGDRDFDSLGVLEQFQRDNDGVYRRVPGSANLDPSAGDRTANGIFQYGLTKTEINELSDRVHSVLDRVDHGQIKLF